MYPHRAGCAIMATMLAETISVFRPAGILGMEL